MNRTPYTTKDDGQRELQRFRRAVRCMPLLALIAITEALYERVHHSIGDARRDSTGAVLEAWSRSLESDRFYEASGELGDRANSRVRTLMRRVKRALETGNVTAFRRASAEYRSWEPVLQRWAFAFFRLEDEPGFEDAGWGFDIEVSEYTSTAARLRAADHHAEQRREVV